MIKRFRHYLLLSAHIPDDRKQVSLQCEPLPRVTDPAMHLDSISRESLEVLDERFEE